METTFYWCEFWSTDEFICKNLQNFYSANSSFKSEVTLIILNLFFQTFYFHFSALLEPILPPTQRLEYLLSSVNFVTEWFINLSEIWAWNCSFNREENTNNQQIRWKMSIFTMKSCELIIIRRTSKAIYKKTAKCTREA